MIKDNFVTMLLYVAFPPQPSNAFCCLRQGHSFELTIHVEIKAQTCCFRQVNLSNYIDSDILARPSGLLVKEKLQMVSIPGLATLWLADCVEAKKEPFFSISNFSLNRTALLNSLLHSCRRIHVVCTTVSILLQIIAFSAKSSSEVQR